MTHNDSFKIVSGFIQPYRGIGDHSVGFVLHFDLGRCQLKTREDVN